MKALLITPKNQSEFKFLSDLLAKLDVSTMTMAQEEIEDLGLSQLLKSIDKAKTVSKESIISKLTA